MKRNPQAKKPPLRYEDEKFHPSTRGDASHASASVSFKLPSGGYEALALYLPLTPVKLSGLLMVASLLWSSLKRSKDGTRLMRLTDAAALRFVDGVRGCSNPTTFVARAWGCLQATKGCNINGKIANSWHLPEWWKGGIEKVTVRLTARQFILWRNRGAIMRECLDQSNPHAAIVRETLRATKPGINFINAVEKLTELGERDSVKAYRRHPEKLNVTRDGDVQSSVSRLPAIVREALSINGQSVAEFDIQSAHAALLGMFYNETMGAGWEEEKVRFAEETQAGFPSLYGTGDDRKRRKIEFLSALNQETRVARFASEAWRDFEHLFPMLGRKVARMKKHNKDAVGRRLRVELAEIIKCLVLENGEDRIQTIPVVDSALVAMPDDVLQRHRAEFRTAWRLAFPIFEKTGTAPCIVGSNGEKYRFF